MTDDLVRRLRKCHENRANVYAYNEAICAYEEEREEAADALEAKDKEIERLKARLYELTEENKRLREINHDFAASNAEMT